MKLELQLSTYWLLPTNHGIFPETHKDDHVKYLSNPTK